MLGSLAGKVQTGRVTDVHSPSKVVLAFYIGEAETELQDKFELKYLS